jgi:hypothetical protein
MPRYFPPSYLACRERRCYFPRSYKLIKKYHVIFLLVTKEKTIVAGDGLETRQSTSN